MGVLSSIYQEALEQSTSVEAPAIEKDWKLARIMVEGYFDWAEETGVDADLEITDAEVDIEYEFEVQGRRILLVGKRDAIGVFRSTGTTTLIDHKTCQSFNDPALDLNEQARMYLLLQRLNGSTPVQNCFWNLLRKVQRTARAEPPFYKREELYVSEDELRRYWTRINGIITDILEIRDRLDNGESHYSVCYPRPSRDCSWKCSFRVVCPLIDSEGEKAEDFVLNQFRQGDPYERYSDAKGE